MVACVCGREMGFEIFEKKYELKSGYLNSEIAHN